MQVVCVECGREMNVEKNGVIVEETTEDQQPYKLWSADLYECPDCGRKVITGFAQHPLAMHHETRYNELKYSNTVYQARCR